MNYRINLAQILIKSEDIGWMGLLEVVLSNLLKELFYNFVEVFF